MRQLDNSQAWSTILIVMVSIAVNLPYFSNAYYPVHDTLSVFQFFSYYYSQLLLTHTLPWWLPYSAYGMPIDSYLLFSFGPFQYLALTLGYLFHIKNTLYLFSLALLGDTLFLALGSYVFCRHILQNKLATLFCVLSILILIQYDRQIYWNFKILLPLPLCLYWIQLGIERLNPTYLLLSIATLLCWTFGSIAYVLPVQVYILACYGLCLLLSSVTQPTHLLTSRNLCLSFIACLIIMLCVYTLFNINSVMTTEMAYNAVGRQADLSVGLEYYLNYGGNTGHEKLIELLTGLPTSHPHDFLAYVGVVNLILVCYGFSTVFAQRSRSNPVPLKATRLLRLRLAKTGCSSQIALAITTLFILAFTVTSTHVAEIAYYLPGMNRVRHIGYFITIAKLFLIILAGFGVRAYLKVHKPKTQFDLMYMLPLTLSITCLTLTPLINHTPYTFHALSISLLVLMLTLGCQLFRVSPRPMLFGLLLISLIDMTSYRLTIYKMADLFLIPYPKAYTEVRPNHYQPTRTILPTSPYTQLKPLGMYGIGANYLQQDICPAPRQDLISRDVKTLFFLRQPLRTKTDIPEDFLNPMQDKPLKRAIGCGTPKLRLTSQVHYVSTQQEAANYVSTQAIDTYPVIISPAQPHELNPTHNSSLILQRFSANTLQVNVNNTTSHPLWLLYADAFNPRWHATIDNIPTPIIQNNLAFKAVQIKPGRHEVKFIFMKNATEFKLFWGMMLIVACGVLYGFITHTILTLEIDV